jgi:hypothetical protein
VSVTDEPELVGRRFLVWVLELHQPEVYAVFRKVGGVPASLFIELDSVVDLAE